jgi:NAD-dependent deacetylase
MEALLQDKIKKVCEAIREAKHCVVFTGAGISVESGIAPFRGEGGVYNELDPDNLQYKNYINNPTKSWKTIKQLLFKAGDGYQPNKAHQVIGKLEEAGMVKAVITQNIDNLHQEGGTNVIYELHGNGKNFVCTKCGHMDEFDAVEIDVDFPICSKCGELTKPDFTFFGEDLPMDQFDGAIKHVNECDLMILVGTSGEVYPAAQLPVHSKGNGATIIEINTESSAYTYQIVDTIIQGKAGEVFSLIESELFE